MDNQYNNGNQNYGGQSDNTPYGQQNYGATMPVDNPGYVQTQYNPTYGQGQQNYGATMPVDNPGYVQTSYNTEYGQGQQDYGATMPVDNPGYGQTQYNPTYGQGQQGYGATMPVDNPGYGQSQYNQSMMSQNLPPQNLPPQNLAPQNMRQNYNQPQYEQSVSTHSHKQYGHVQNRQEQYSKEPVSKQKKTQNRNSAEKNKGSGMSAGWLIALCASIIVIIVGTAIICFVAMGKKKQIKDVKNASIQLSGASYTATYGELFSKSIGGAKWDYFKEDGEKLVQVTGDYNDKLNNRTDPIIVQFNVDDGVKLSCIAINANALSLTDSERVITEMYNSYYGAGNTTVSTEATEVTTAVTEATTEAATEATTAATEATTQATTEEAKKEYILENSSTTYLAVSDIAGLTKEQCRIARNEIYARHGRLFDDDELQAYFNSCSWYQGKIAPGEFDENSLSAIEKANLELIVNYEKDMGYR